MATQGSSFFGDAVGPVFRTASLGLAALTDGTLFSLLCGPAENRFHHHWANYYFAWTSHLWQMIPERPGAGRQQPHGLQVFLGPHPFTIRCHPVAVRYHLVTMLCPPVSSPALPNLINT